MFDWVSASWGRCAVFPEWIMLERGYLMTVQKFTVYETLEKFKMPTVFAV